jgi:ubiquinone/menaquinone biosynthesis C-methylase UbiE
MWDERAKLGVTSGTQDLILRALEQRYILGLITNPYDEVMEVGAGTGETAAMVKDRLEIGMRAIDSSPAMVSLANVNSSAHGWGVEFEVGDAMEPPKSYNGHGYDIVYSQRCLINLPSWEAQKQAIDAIASVLVPGGRFLMCEHSADGLEAINEARVAIGLSEINAPWHNRYFGGYELSAITSLKLVGAKPFSATYYYHSRVINAALAAKAGQEPDYDSEVNRLALTLPADCVDPRFAQGRLWIWEKA